MEGTEEEAAQRYPPPARPSQPATEMEVTSCSLTPIHRWGGLEGISQGPCPVTYILRPHLHPLSSEEAGGSLEGAVLRAFGWGETRRPLWSSFHLRLHRRLPPGALCLYLWSPAGLVPHSPALQPAAGCSEPGEKEDKVGFYL